MSYSIDLGGQVALVTGAAQGIGAAIAQKLAQAGAQVVINDVCDKEKAEETFSFIPDRTCSSLCSSCDGNHSVAVWKPASWNDRI